MVTAKHWFQTRSLRLIFAFFALMSSVVLVPGAPKAEAASDDLMIAVSVDNSSIAQGAVSNWTLTIDTSADMTLATGIVVTDTVPDGLCPYGAGDAECAAGVAPSPAYTSATENADGSWTLVWDLADMGPASQTIVTFATQARANYREGFADDTPVLARDSWVNTASVTGTVDATLATDVATVGQAAAGVVLQAQVATRPAALSSPGVCGDGSTLTWNDTSAAYRIGDQVCWRLIVDYPVDLVTADSVVSLSIPSGQKYTAGDVWSTGANNTVPPADVDGASVTPGNSTLTWHIGDGDGYVTSDRYLEIVFSTTVTNPAATSSGQTVTGVAGHTHKTTSGSSINTPDVAAVRVLEPEIDLGKGVVAVNATSTGGPSDGEIVSESDVVTYQLAVTNSGDVDAADVVVWDLLPALLAPCTSRVSAIGDGGVCVDAGNRVEWTGPNTLSVAAGTTVDVTYQATVPAGIAPETTLTNRAGVTTYTSATNNGTFSYIPASNVDTGSGTSNTASADDTSRVVTASTSIVATRTTGIDEPGNHATSQATIGELITYTVTVVIPEGTTVWSGQLFDDLPANLDLVSASHTFDGEEPVARSENTGADSVTVDFAGPSYRNAPGTGDDTLVLTIVGRVIDVPANSRGTSISNSAALTWLDQDAVQHTKGASVSTTVVEPLLGVVKSSVDSIGNNGVVVGNEVVDYSVTVTNPGTANVATAHEVTVVDSIPEGVTLTLPVPDGGVWAADSTPGDGIGGTITWSVASLAAGSSLARSYQVTVDDPVVVSTTFVNTVAVDGTSMAGTPAVERTAGTGYHSEVGHILNTPLATISRDADPSAATIGEIVTNTINITMPPGTIMYDATVIDTLPAGLVFDGIISSTCDMEGSPCDPMITATEIGISGTTTAAFFLGDIDESSTTGEDRVVSIQYQAHLLDSGSAGDTRVSAVEVFGNQVDEISGTPASVPLPSSFDVAVGPSTDTVTVAEPHITIDKDVAGQAGDGDFRRAVPGETLTYTIVATNSSAAHTSNAYDLVIVDTLPERLSLTLPIADGGVWVPDATPGDGVGGTITWAVAGPVAPMASVTRTYQATVEAGLDSGDEDTGSREAANTADVTSYFALAAATRATYPGFTYREYDDVTSDTVEVEFDLASIGGVVWFDVDADGVRESGEPSFDGVDLAVTYLGADGHVGSDDEPHLATTAADGSSLVDHLPGGTYTVVVDGSDLPDGFVPSYDLDGGTLTPDGAWGPGPLGESEDKLDVDFGYTGVGSIGGTVWFDSDADQAPGGTEYGLEGVDVMVTWLGVDGVPGVDDVAYPVATDSDGSYLVPRLPAGNYTIVLDTDSVPGGMVPTYDSDGTGTPATALVTLTEGTDDPDQDFGFTGTGAIGDFVWLDRDGDGGQDAGEPGIAYVPVELTWPGEDGVLGGGDDEVFLESTGSDGSYTFANMPPGEYQIIITGGLPAAAPATYDEDGGGDAATTIVLGDGETHLTADFGFHGTASIGDEVWWDLDGDGTRDVGEPGIPAVDVSLTFAGLDGAFDNGDDLIFTATTDGTGSYLIADLPAGDYEVTIVSGVPGGMVQTHDETGGLDGMSLVPGLSVDEIHLTADFGYEGVGSIGDYVWLDLDADGAQDAAEPGLPDVALTITWAGVDGVLASSDDVGLVATTDIDGNYLVSGLPDGLYEADVDPATLPIGVVPTHDFDGTGTPDSTLVALAGGAGVSDIDFGYHGGAIVGNLVWFDQDGDGMPGSNEYGIAGVTVDVIWAGADYIHTTADDETFTRITGSDGSYQVPNLPRGSYAVVIDTASLPPGMTATHDEDGVLDDRTLFTVEEGDVHLTADFGYAGTGEIGDLVWFDRDGDGLEAPDEPGIPGQEITVTAAGGDDVFDTADDETYLALTDSDGGYSFSNLPPARYSVEVTGSIVAHAVNTSDEDGDLDSRVEITLGDGVAHAESDFGYRGAAQIGDFVWVDIDADGVDDPGEPALPGVDVAVTWLGGDGVVGGGDDLVAAVATTDAAGSYLATALPSGNLEVAVVAGVPSGFDNSGDPDGDSDGRTTVTGMEPDAMEMGIDFGYAGDGLVGDMVWWDLDGDGIQSTREPGMSDVSVELTWAGLDGSLDTGDDVGWVAVTDTTGTYLFSELPPGGYRVSVDTATTAPGVVPSVDPDGSSDGSPDGNALIVLEPYGSNVDQDFGLRGDSSIGGSVWIDVDNDGMRSPAEPGVGGAMVTVSYLGPDEPGTARAIFTSLVPTTGAFSVPGLPSGFFEVMVDEASLPDGISLAGDGTGTRIVPLTLGATATADDISFRTIGDAVIGGLVWNDRDGDQSPGSSEVGVASVAVTIVWKPPSGDVALATETDAFGMWRVENLPPGVYEASIDGLSLPIGMSATTSPNLPAVLDPGGETAVDFGIALLLELGSWVWIDGNGNGVVDDGEKGIPGALVNLYDEIGALVAITATGSEGRYGFSELYPGQYSVVVDVYSVPGRLRPSWDRDGVADLVTAIDLTGGEHVLDANFGFQEGLPLTGFDVDVLALWGAILAMFGIGLVLASNLVSRRRMLVVSCTEPS